MEAEQGEIDDGEVKMKYDEDTYHNDSFHKKQQSLRWGRVGIRQEEGSYHQGDLYEWPLMQSLSLGRVVVLFIAAITIAELFVFAGSVKGGLSIHFLALISVPFAIAVIRDRQTRFALQALMLLPLLRLINVSMPMSEAPLLIFVAVYIPLLVPVFLLIRHQRLTDTKMGMVYDRLAIYIPLAIAVGALLGAGEYLIVGSSYQISGLPEPFILVFASVMFFYVGMMEELIFRSLIQTQLEGLFGLTPGLFLASLLFGVMHSIYGEITEMVYIFAAGILLGYMFQRTRSLPLVAISHGVANIVLFVMLPLILL